MHGLKVSGFRFAALVLSAAVGSAGFAGFIASFATSYADGPKNSNHYTAIWLCGVAMLLAVQAACVILAPSCSTGGPRPRARFWAWVWYTSWMASCGLILLIGLGIALPAQSGWAVLWLVASAVMLPAVFQHRRAVAAQQPPAAVAHGAVTDVEASIIPNVASTVLASKVVGPLSIEQAQATTDPAQGPKARKSCGCSKAGCRRCCSGCGSCMAWSSLFWGAVLGLFLVIQAASLAHDKQAYPHPGRLAYVNITEPNGDQTTVKLHIFCTGAITPGVANFILEAGGGAPGLSMAGIADGLAAAGRRACWYDRLGYGWSDDAFQPTTPDRNTEALKNLLAAVPDMAPGPFILVGHSAGGQIAMQYATLHPNDVAGLALLDSYNDVAIYLYMMRGAGTTMATYQLQRADGTTMTLPNAALYYARTVPILDLLRAVEPLTWSRWITSGGKTGKYGPVIAALYGNNKAWQAQWVEVKALAAGRTGADSLTLASGRQVWQGAGWPDFSPKPVLLMPAAKILQLPTVCLSTDGSAPSDYTTSAQCVDTLRDPTSFCQSLHGASGGAFNKCMADAVYPDLYRAYKETLSSATTLFVLPGGHGTVTENPDMTVQQLVTKFAGV